MSMQNEINWITDALSTKNIAREMTHYRVDGGQIRATDGRLTAGCPWPYGGSFLVPGSEFEKLIKRLPAGTTLEQEDNSIVLKSGRSRGTIQTRPVEEWNYPGVAEEAWEPVPEGLLTALQRLLPFVSDNATQNWALGVALENGYAFATNNVALAGVRLPSIAGVRALLPVWAASFVVDRWENCEQWAWSDSYVAFRWSDGSWMRAQLINAVFPEQAVTMIKRAEQLQPSQAITKEFKEAFRRVAPLVAGSESISLGRTSVSGAFGMARLEDEVELNIDADKVTFWSGKYLAPVIDVATHWEPNDWPSPCAFAGNNLFGYVVGRRQ